MFLGPSIEEMGHTDTFVGLNWGFLDFMGYFGPKIFFALVCGGLVGLERELKHKAAGIKTNMLICAGAALYTSVSVLISQSYAEKGYFGDPGRVAAQIVSGIGFLGGGAIIQSRGTVVGLTTAATIWVVAAIGVCVGLGKGLVAIAVSLLVIAVLVLITFLENRFMARSNVYVCEITAEDPKGEVRTAVHHALEAHDLMLDDFDISKTNEHTVLKVKYRGHPVNQRSFLLALWSNGGVREVKRL